MDDFEPPEMPEKPESRHERAVGLIIAVIAVVLAVVSALSRDTDYDKILAHVDAADQYAFYQAKHERRTQMEETAGLARLIGAALPAGDQAQAAALIAHDESEAKRLENEGRAVQEKGDELMRESHRLEGKARLLNLGEIALQISVVLCSITVLTEQRLFVRLGLVTAGAGVLLALAGMLMP